MFKFYVIQKVYGDCQFEATILTGEEAMQQGYLSEREMNLDSEYELYVSGFQEYGQAQQLREETLGWNP